MDNSPYRIGVIFSLISVVDPSFIDSVKSSFMRDDLTLGSRNFELGFLDRQSWEGVEVNRWFRIKTGFQRGNESQHVVEVTLDFNSLGENKYVFDADLVGKFLHELENRADEELKRVDA